MRRIALLVSCVVLAAPGARAADGAEQFADGNRLYHDDLYWAALLRYRQAADSGFDSALLYYNSGVAHYRAQQYARARESFLEAIAEPRLTHRIQYNLGLTELAAGNTENAVTWFQRAGAQQDEPVLASLAAAAVVHISSNTPEAYRDRPVPTPTRRAPERPFGSLELRAALSVGSDDNVFRTPATAYNDLSQPGVPTVSPVVQSGVFYPVDIKAKYSVNSFEHESFFGSYRVSGRYYHDEALDNASEYAHQLAFGTEYERQTDTRERKIYSAFTISSYDGSWYDRDDGTEREFNDGNVGSRLSYARYGPEIWMRQSYSRLSFNVHAKGQIWNYDDTEALPEYDHEYLHIGASFQYRFTSTSLLRVKVDAWQRRFGERPSFDLNGEQPIDNPPIHYDYVQLGATARQRITSLMWFGINYARTERRDKHSGYYDYFRDDYGIDFSFRVNDRFIVRADANYGIYSYLNAFAYNTAAGGRRTLEKADARLLATWRFTPRLSLVAGLEHRDIESNDQRIAYTRNQVMLGLHWRQ